MKTKIISFLSKPKLVITGGSLVAIFFGFLIYPYIGRAPQVDISLKNIKANADVVASGSSLDLAFPKSGRIESVLVKKGDMVKKGDILAKLSAPDALGLVSQAKGALALAEAQYTSLDLNYANTKKQQDIVVDNAYQTLLKTTPEAVAKDESGDSLTINYPLPAVSGNYILGKEGVITVETYIANGGLAFNTTGLVEDTKVVGVNPTPIGNSGLSILFSSKVIAGLTWTITLPNTKNPNYSVNKNTYDLALVNRDRVLADLAANLGQAGSQGVAKAQIDAARGAYEAALGAYQNNIILSPINGVINFVDENIKPGQSVVAGKTVISITAN